MPFLFIKRRQKERGRWKETKGDKWRQKETKGVVPLGAQEGNTAMVKMEGDTAMVKTGLRLCKSKRHGKDRFRGKMNGKKDNKLLHKRIPTSHFIV